MLSISASHSSFWIFLVISPARKIFHNIFNEIISLENLFLAWNEFRKGKSKKSDVQEFEYNLENNIFKLHHELKNQTYSHFNYTSFNICDPKPRKIHKACVRDRVLHHAVFRILYPIFDKTFIFDSYSCRNGKGTHRAINRLKQFAGKVSKNKTKTCFVLKCDIRKFFDSIGQNVLISLIRKKIKDENAIWLIGKIIRSFSTAENRVKTKKRMFKKIKINRQRLKTGLINDKSFRQSPQSYYGILKHCDGYKLKKEVEIILRKG